jgi:hypothetical protein
MKGSWWSRVSATGADASPKLSPELVERSSRKNAISNEHKWAAIGDKVAPRPGAPDAQIKDQTETDLTLKGFCETRQRFDAS